MTELAEDRLKRLRIRSWRRGTKEMDLILGRWSDVHLATLDDTDIETYDAMLSENDHDLYQWVTGQAETPERFRAMIDRIAREATGLPHA
ncbi:MAG: succinate dehydrogenase assembly factor 2 [Pseudomonadota bacterium]